MFGAITPENRAEIVKTQFTRWRDMNRQRPNREQMALLDERIAALVPGAYARPRDRQASARLHALTGRVETLFAREDIWWCSVSKAPYVPPPA